MALRASERFNHGDIQNPLIRELFLNIGMAKVSSSAHEAMDLGLLRKGKDAISINKKRLIADAKAAAISLADKGYRPPANEKNKSIRKTNFRIFLGGGRLNVPLLVSLPNMKN